MAASAQAGPPPAAVALPKLAALGALPPVQTTVPVEIGPDGTLRSGGRTHTVAELGEHLRVASRTLAPRGAPGEVLPSDVNVLIRADAGLPFSTVATVVALCGRSDVLAQRVFFAAQSSRDGQEGAFAWFLPGDQRGAPALSVRLTHERPGVAPTSLGEPLRRALQRRTAQPEAATVLLDLPPDVRFGDVLAVAAVAAEAGASGVVCRLSGPAGSGTQAVAVSPQIQFAGKPIVNDPRPQPAKPLVAGEVGLTGGVWVENCVGLLQPLRTGLPPVLDPGGWYGLRVDRRRRPVAGSSVAQAIDSGLQWLVRHQDPDGKWDADGFTKHDGEAPCGGAGHALQDVGVTALAVLALLGDGHTPAAGAYADAVKRGLRWLVEHQLEDGRIRIGGDEWLTNDIYDHAVATQALVEGFALTSDPALRGPASRALAHIEAVRNPYSVWRYGPRDNDNDTSVSTWCGFAMVLGRQARLEVPEVALQQLTTWYDSVSDPTGAHGYTKQGEPSARLSDEDHTRWPVAKTRALTAAAAFTRFALGQDPKEKPKLLAALDQVANCPPVWSPNGGSIDLYYWYFGTAALQRAGGPAWQKWWKQVVAALVPSQRKDANAAGSWDPIDPWSQFGGRVYATAMAVMTLEAPYRWQNIGR